MTKKKSSENALVTGGLTLILFYGFTGRSFYCSIILSKQTIKKNIE